LRDGEHHGYGGEHGRDQPAAEHRRKPTRNDTGDREQRIGSDAAEISAVRVIGLGLLTLGSNETPRRGRHAERD
jgi:hypothetical protein